MVDIMGVPQLVNFKTDSGNTGEPFIVIPSLHPGRIGHGGVVKDKLVRLLVLVSGIAWSAATLTMQQDLDESTLPRAKKINNILDALNAKLAPDTDFGKAMTKAKNEHVLTLTAWNEGKLARGRGAPIKKPPGGLLPGKTTAKRARTTAEGTNETVESIGDIFEVAIQKVAWSGQDGEMDRRYQLSWTEVDGQVWSISPVMLPPNVLSSTANEKRFLC
jgi:hypothetical protein